MGCVAGVVIATIESRRTPMDEHLREAVDNLRMRLAKLEGVLNGYPTSREMTEQHANLDAMFGDVARRMDRLEDDLRTMRHEGLPGNGPASEVSTSANTDKDDRGDGNE